MDAPRFSRAMRSRSWAARELKIRVCDACHHRQRDDVAGEASGNRRLIGHQGETRNSAPEIDDVTRTGKRAICIPALCATAPAEAELVETPPATAPVLVTVDVPPVTGASEWAAVATPLMFGNNGAPAMRACASACMMRATATAMSRLEVCAPRLVGSCRASGIRATNQARLEHLSFARH